MLTGKCYTVRGNLTEPLNETKYLSTKASLDDLVPASICVVVGLAGLVLNSLSLVVFAKVFAKSNNRNNFHLFFVLLSVCEIAFCIGSVLTYTMNIVSVGSDYYVRWEGTDPRTGDQQISESFRYSINLPASSSTGAEAFANFLNISNYLAVLSQFSRNCWVSITALLRCYVATRRTNVQVSQVYATRRVLSIFAAKVLIIIILALIRTYLKDPGNFMRTQFHLCDTGNWTTEVTVLLHMPMKVPKYWDIVNMVWNMLGQFIPLVVIIASSVILVFSLRSGATAGVGSSSAERNKRITRMVFIFALTFALLEGPRALCFAFFKYITHPLLRRRLPQVTYFLSQADSIVNAFIYFFNDQHFRKELCGEPKLPTQGGQGQQHQRQQRQSQQQQQNRV